MNQPFKMTEIYRYETKLLKTIATIENNLKLTKFKISSKRKAKRSDYAEEGSSS